MIGVLLVNFSFSKKLVGLLSESDVLSRVFPGSFPHFAHFLILSCGLEITVHSVQQRITPYGMHPQEHSRSGARMFP